MWSYYGAKTNLVHLYPPPIYDEIIEPFAGSARYSLKYFDREVLLVDKYDVIIKIWKWIQQCSPHDILQFINLKGGEDLKEMTFDCEEQKLFLGFIIGYGSATPRNIVSKTMMDNRNNRIKYSLKNISSNLWKIKHWKFYHGEYSQIENRKCTWYIDPPYQFGGQHYKESNKKIDFGELAECCKNRNGQILVCENTKADWLPFKPIRKHRGSKFFTTEAIWTNMPSCYNNLQQTLDL